jgi:hypothetical protein
MAFYNSSPHLELYCGSANVEKGSVERIFMRFSFSIPEYFDSFANNF